MPPHSAPGHRPPVAARVRHRIGARPPGAAARLPRCPHWLLILAQGQSAVLTRTGSACEPPVTCDCDVACERRPVSHTVTRGM